MSFGQNDAQGHGNAIDIPGHDQQDKADAEKPGIVLTFATSLGCGRFGTAFGDVTAVANV